tara:strand:- start:40 stop:303 length:264 start_codon:yes stop_codon:yes gene_type:complete
MSIPLEVEGLEKKQHENPFNYTEDQLQEKQLALKTMKDLYPDVSPFYAEIVYDLCKNNTPEEIDKIKEKISNTPSKYVIPEVLEFKK